MFAYITLHKQILRTLSGNTFFHTRLKTEKKARQRLAFISVSICNNYFAKSSRWHRHSNSGPPFFLIWSLPRLWYGSLSGSISLNHLSIFYNISRYNSLVLLTFVSRSSCRITYIYIKVWNNRQNTKRESSLRLDILQ